MAKIGSVNVKFTINNQSYEKAMLVYCNDGLLERIDKSTTSYQEIYSISKLAYPIDVAKYFDMYMGDDLWAAQAVPLNSQGSSDYKSWIKTIFPNAYEVDGSSNVNSAVSVNDIASTLYMKTHGAYYYPAACGIIGNIYNNTTSIDMSQLAIFGASSFMASSMGTNACIAVCPESILEGGELNLDKNYNGDFATLTFRLFKEKDGTFTGRIACFYKAGYDSPSSMPGYHYLNGADTKVLTDVPNENGGTSDTGGGDGEFDGDGEDIIKPDLPHLNAATTGFITIYNPTLGQLQELSNFMWSTDFTDNLVKLFANPMDVILGLNILPVNIPNGGAVEVKVGAVSTGVSMNKANSQYTTLDCGTLQIKEYWGSYLDYSPYTKIQIYLPYVGYKELNPDEVMGKNLNVIYHIDILTGACIAYIRSENTILYQFNGQCSQTIPVTGSDYSALIGTIATLVVGAGIAVATGGAGTGAAAGMLGQATAASAGLSLPTSVTGVGALASSTVGAVMGSKPGFERSGNISGVGGQLAVQKPYIIVTRPKQALPRDFNQYEGYPSNITSRLGDLTGFTQVEKIKLSKMSSTLIETNEIYKLLGEGVII